MKKEKALKNAPDPKYIFEPLLEGATEIEVGSEKSMQENKLSVHEEKIQRVFQKVGVELPLSDIKDIAQTTNKKLEHILVCKSSAAFLLTAIACTKWIKSNCSDYSEDGTSRGEFQKYAYESDAEKTDEIVIIGCIRFVLNGKLFCLNLHIDALYCNLASKNEDVSEVAKEILEYAKRNNIVKNKHMHLFMDQHGDDLKWSLKKEPKMTWQELVLDEKMKEDIYDSTLFHIDNMETNNGIILYGPPGTGKSLTCQAIIGDAIRKGYSTCYITSYINFTLLDDFLEKFLAPCVLVLEDIETIALSRDISDNQRLSDFLQFMNGVTERSERIIVIATTNHIEKVDNAVANRPMRFNQKYLIDMPNDKELDRIIDYIFNEKQLSEELKNICHGHNFGGAHIRAIYDRCKLLQKKMKDKDVAFDDIFRSAVSSISMSFDKKPSKVGFAAHQAVEGSSKMLHD